MTTITPWGQVDDADTISSSDWNTSLNEAFTVLNGQLDNNNVSAAADAELIEYRKLNLTNGIDNDDILATADIDGTKLANSTLRTGKLLSDASSTLLHPESTLQSTQTAPTVLAATTGITNTVLQNASNYTNFTGATWSATVASEPICGGCTTWAALIWFSCQFSYTEQLAGVNEGCPAQAFSVWRLRVSDDLGNVYYDTADNGHYRMMQWNQGVPYETKMAGLGRQSWHALVTGLPGANAAVVPTTITFQASHYSGGPSVPYSTWYINDQTAGDLTEGTWTVFGWKES